MNTLRSTLVVVLVVLYHFFPVLIVCFKMSAALFKILMSGGTCGRRIGFGPMPRCRAFDPFSGQDGTGQSGVGGKGQFSKQEAVAAKSGAGSSKRGTPWVDYSWAAQLVLGGCYRIFGLRGLVVYAAIQVFLIVLAFHVLVRRMPMNLLLSSLLTFAATLGMLPLATPRPGSSPCSSS